MTLYIFSKQRCYLTQNFYFKIYNRGHSILLLIILLHIIIYLEFYGDRDLEWVIPSFLLFWKSFFFHFVNIFRI